MYYPSVMFGDDISSSFCIRVPTYTHSHTHTRTYRVAKRPIHASDCGGVSKNVGRAVIHTHVHCQ